MSNATRRIDMQPVRRGPKPGSKHGRVLTQKEWHSLCDLYVNSHDDMAQRDFLISNVSGGIVSGTSSECVSFSRRLKLFRNGDLIPSESKRNRRPEFTALEAKIVAYIRENHQNLAKESANLWQHILSVSADWAHDFDEPIYRGFKASAGWLRRVLRRNSIDLKISSEPSNEPPSAFLTPRHASHQVNSQQHQLELAPALTERTPLQQEDLESSPVSLQQQHVEMSDAQQQIIALRKFAIGLGISVSGLGHLVLFENELYQADPTTTRLCSTSTKSIW
ncbi:hypothetical protein MPSEU_000098200 [Mayamaea pseudoterrestris]|nr:hypothetical protein MPSEU_000097500 [Mayamaea pseudoterrestris]GKY91256.1 hypothetical protein MPSEU_000098200 [Mayamaea pseudoterrestris]